MSLPLFKDYDKHIQDFFNDDFDTKFALKIKALAPYRVNVTQTTEFLSKAGKTSLNGKVSAKWAHDSGFTLDKLEMKHDGSLVTESSLTGLYPGLKLEFKGDDSFKGDLGAIYKCSSATAAAEVDLVEFSSVKASVLGATGPINIGACAELKTGDKAELRTLDVATSYSANNIFFGLKTGNKFADYTASVSYVPNSQYTVAGKTTFTPEKSNVNGTIGLSFQCCPNSSFKVKASSDGIVSGSIKQSCGKGFTVVGAAKLDIHDPLAFTLGITTTLG
jgi:hypothetical protein